MNFKPFTLAMAQMRVYAGDRARNIGRAVELIAEAAANGANVVLLPECCDLGWTDPSSLTQAQPIPDGEPCQALMRAAREHGVYVCAGLTERAATGVFNSAVLIDAQGTLLRVHRKINELDIGHPYYGLGDSLAVVPTEYGVLGVMICADATAKDGVLARSLCYMGADVILSPCAWAVPADHDNAKEPYGALWRDAYQAIAREFSTAVIGVSNVGRITDGPWKGWRCIGCSLGVGPEGDELVRGSYGADAEHVLYVEVTPQPRPARGTDWHAVWEAPQS